MTRLENIREFKSVHIEEKNSITNYINKLVKNSMYMLTLEMIFAVLVFSAVAIMIFLYEEAVNELVRRHIGILGGIFALCYIYFSKRREKTEIDKSSIEILFNCDIIEASNVNNNILVKVKTPLKRITEFKLAENETVKSIKGQCELAKLLRGGKELYLLNVVNTSKVYEIKYI